MAEFADAWWAERRDFAQSDTADPNAPLPDDPAQDQVFEWVVSGSPLALEAIVVLVNAAESVAELLTVGAGPLEDLLSHHGHAEAFVEDVEIRARRSDRSPLQFAVYGLAMTCPS